MIKEIQMLRQSGVAIDVAVQEEKQEEVKAIDLELRRIRKMQREKRESWLEGDEGDEPLPASSQAVPGRVEIEWVPEQEPDKERFIPGRLDIQWPLTEEQER